MKNLQGAKTVKHLSKKAEKTTFWIVNINEYLLKVRNNTSCIRDLVKFSYDNSESVPFH